MNNIDPALLQKMLQEHAPDEFSKALKQNPAHVQQCLQGACDAIGQERQTGQGRGA